jgi:CheY-like chemotaxis protein
MPCKLVLLDGQMPEMDGFGLAEKIKADPGITPVTLMMLSSGAQLADAQRCRELGVSAYLTKPLKQSELLDTILSLICQTHANNGDKRQTDSTLLANAGRPLTILLAEDNPVNQRVAKGILEKRRHIVTAVVNGLEALEALKTQKFDLVLMDLQMPEMDGFAATAAIREQEKTSGKHLPIVAMTARAMKGDRECCLQAGMDGYISKPVNPRELLECIHSVVESVGQLAGQPKMAQVGESIATQSASESQPADSMKSRSTSMETDAIDLEALLERVENDTTLLEEMIQLYMESSPRLMSDIESGVQRRDAASIQRAAHTLKGALQNLSAGPSAALAKQMENAGRLEDLNAADQSLNELKRELDRLQSALTNWTEGAMV